MTFDDHHEDAAILAALEDLNRPRLPEAPAGEDPLTREITELFGLLAYQLEPAAPRPEVEDRIREGIRAQRRPEVRSEATLVPFPRRPSAAPAEAGRSSSRGAGRAVQAVFAMAAVLAVCLLGLGFLLGKTREQQTTISRLQSDIETSIAQVRQAEVDRRNARLEMINTVARFLYPMHPVAVDARGSHAVAKAVATAVTDAPPTGRVWVCGRHQQWYVNRTGLEDPPPGKEYHMWFVTRDDSMVDAGVLEVTGSVAELDAMSMPTGTKGFAVTLEACGDHEQPEGEMLFVGEEAQTLF